MAHWLLSSLCRSSVHFLELTFVATKSSGDSHFNELRNPITHKRKQIYIFRERRRLCEQMVYWKDRYSLNGSGCVWQKRKNPPICNVYTHFAINFWKPKKMIYLLDKSQSRIFKWHFYDNIFRWSLSVCCVFRSIFVRSICLRCDLISFHLPQLWLWRQQTFSLLNNYFGPRIFFPSSRNEIGGDSHLSSLNISWLFIFAFGIWHSVCVIAHAPNYECHAIWLISNSAQFVRVRMH